MKWFRLWFDIVDDHKIAQLNDYEFRVFIFLMALASEEDAINGRLTRTLPAINRRLRRRYDHLKRAVETFQKVGLITISEDGFIIITNWNKRQFKSDDSYGRVKKLRYEQAVRNVSVTANETPSDSDSDTDTDILSKDNIKNSAVKPPRFDFEIQEILKMYHEILPGCPAVKENGTIPKSLRRRILEKTDRQELVWWKEYFQYVAMSDFLTGKKTDFVADLEWMIGPKNMQKVLNGRYHRDHKSGCSGIDEWVRINREKFTKEKIENGKEN